MALVVSLTPGFLCRISLLFLVVGYAVPAPFSLCSLENYVNFNVKRINRSPSWHQSNMIKQITNYIIMRGLTCGLNKTGSYCSEICAPLDHTLRMVYLHAFRVMYNCKRAVCSEGGSLLNSRVPPCRAIVMTSNIPELDALPFMLLTYKLPAYLEFNITIWKSASKRDPLANSECKNSASLAVWELESNSSRPVHLRARFCGHTPIQSIMSPVQTFFLVWRPDFPYETAGTICLSYQPTAIGYARQHVPSYPWSSLVDYFKDELIDRNFQIDRYNRSRMRHISHSRHGIRDISVVFKTFATSIHSRNVLYSCTDISQAVHYTVFGLSQAAYTLCHNWLWVIFHVQPTMPTPRNGQL